MRTADGIGGLSNVIDRLGKQLPLLAARKAGAALYGAPALNAFKLFRPNENALSCIIADLFDPHGTHGQGLLFVNLLLHKLNLPRIAVSDAVTVRREVTTRTRRRIDLVIGTPRLLIGIENKPWAVQQDEQLSDYLVQLRGWAGSRQVALIFLSDQVPATAKEEVMPLPFVAHDDGASLLSVLESAKEHIRAPRTRMHIDEMIEYLEAEFGYMPMIDTADMPYVEAVEAEFERGIDGRKAVSLTLLAHHVIHARILDEIAEHIVASVRALKSDFELGCDTSMSEALAEKNGMWTIRRPSWPSNCVIAIAAGRTNFGDIYFGVRAPDPHSAKVDKINDACRSRTVVEAAMEGFQGGRKDPWWPFWQYAAPENWDAATAAKFIIESSTGHVENHPRIAQLTEQFVAYANAVDKAVSGDSA